MDKNSNKNWSLLICLALTFAITAVYYQVCSYGFVAYDDPAYVSENPNIQAGITINAIKWAFTTIHTGYWHALTWLSLMLTCQLFGPGPAGFHFINVLLHVANTLLLFAVLKKMTGALWPSAFTAALFALHPLHVESVAWISEHKDVLSTFFMLLTMAAYLRYCRCVAVPAPKGSSTTAKQTPATGAGAKHYYLLVAVFFALGLMAKPMLVTLPFALLLLDYWPLSRFGSKRSLANLVIEKIPLFVMAAAVCAATFIAQKRSGAMSRTENSGFPVSLVNLANACISYMRYIVKMFWPVRLAVIYPHPGRNVSIFYAAASVIFLLVITILVIQFAKSRRYLFTGWFWYLGTLIPVIGIIQVGSQGYADRYTYTPLIGLFIIIAWGFNDLSAKWTSTNSVELRYRKVALTSSAMLIILAMSICTCFQLRYWQNSLTLFQHALDVTKKNHVAYSGMGDSLVSQGRLDEAIQNYSQAIRIAPKYFPARVGLSDALLKTGKIDQAVVECLKALQINSDEPDALNILGIALGQQGKYDEAVKYFTISLQIRPDFAITHDNMGHVMILQGNYNGAVVHLTESIRLAPAYALPYYHLGQVLVQRGEVNEAVIHFEKALQLKPEWVEPMNAMAWCLAVNEKTAVRNPGKAVKLAHRACELTNFKEPALLDTLAVAYAAAGDFDKAVETAQKALGVCQSSEQEAVKEQIKSQLVLFKNKKPYIENE